MFKNSFHNTINAEGAQLAMFNEIAKTQDEKILQFFKSNPKLELTPFAVQKMMQLNETPITSIRRALCNLTERGELKKTKQVTECYGVKNFCWSLK